MKLILIYFQNLFLKLQISPDYAHKEPLLTNKISAMIDQFKQRKVSPKKIRACKEVKYHGKLSFNNDIQKFVMTKADFQTNIG